MKPARLLHLNALVPDQGIGFRHDKGRERRRCRFNLAR